MNKKDMIKYARQFGWYFTTRAFYLQKRVNLASGNQKIKWADKLNKYRVEKLNYEFSDYIQKQAEKFRAESKQKKQNKTVWFFWWQGNQNEIPMVKMCLNSIRKNLPEGAKMIVISKDNYKKYVDVSQHIIDKFNKGQISITHLSDIVRVNLLSELGGCWLDATIFAVRPYRYVFEKEMWTSKRNENTLYTSKGRWTGFAIGGYSNSIIFKLMKDLFNEYWKRYDVLIDFFLIDLFIELLYRTVPEVKNLIDMNQYNNEDVQKLRPILSQKYDRQIFEELTSNTDLYKLSWRIKVETTIDEENTVYGKLLSQYMDI